MLYLQSCRDNTKRNQEKLRLNLTATGLFRAIDLSKDYLSTASELTLDIEITDIWQGSKSTIVPIVARRDPSVLEISGTIMMGGAPGRKAVLEFMCTNSTGGVSVKSKKWMHENIDKVAEGLRKLLLRISHNKTVTGSPVIANPTNSSNPIEMVWAFSPDFWANTAKSLQRSQDGTGLTLPSVPYHVAVSQVNDDGTVSGLMITKENAGRLFLTYSRMLNKSKRTVFPRLEDTYISPEKLQQIFVRLKTHINE